METLKDEFYNRVHEHIAMEDFQEQDDALLLFVHTGELMDLMFGPKKSALTMAILGEVVKYGAQGEWDGRNFAALEVDSDWRSAWNDKEGWADTCGPVFFDELHELNALSRFGFCPTWRSVDDEDFLSHPETIRRDRVESLADVPAWVESVCSKIDRIEALVPSSMLQDGAIRHMTATRLRARARIKLDLKQPLTVHELAELSDVSTKRLQNAIYAKTDEAPRVDKNGLISPEACEPWLAARDYFPSIWQAITKLYPLKPGWGEDVVYDKGESVTTVDDFVFIPVANDGSEFTPDLLRDARTKSDLGGYAIGPKGDETVVPTYQDALKALHSMDVPRWRRPNPESGNWGVVTGQSWRRVRLSSLEGASK